MAFHFRDGTAPVEPRRVASIQSNPQPRSLAPSGVETDRAPSVSTALIEAPAVRKFTTKKDRRMARRLRSEDSAVMREPAGYASAYSAMSDAEEIEKVGTHDQNIEPELAREPKQNLARLEAIDAIRSLRLR
jgi:hypothetical protein